MAQHPSFHSRGETGEFRRDDTQFSALYSRWRQVAWSEARKHLPCDADADGAVQRVFMRLLQKGPNAWRVDKPGAFFRTAARNEALSTLLSPHRWFMSNDSTDETFLIAKDPLPDEAAARDELRTALSAAIQALPMRCARVMTLLRDGWTHGEIAEELDISIKAVAKQVAGGRRKLRSELTRFARASEAPFSLEDGGGRPAHSSILVWHVKSSSNERQYVTMGTNDFAAARARDIDDRWLRKCYSGMLFAQTVPWLASFGLVLAITSSQCLARSLLHRRGSSPPKQEFWLNHPSLPATV